jgi:hypothetical protein
MVEPTILVARPADRGGDASVPSQTFESGFGALARQAQAFHAPLHPTSSSWLNLVERLFAEITRQRIRRGVFHNVTELENAIHEWIEHRNQYPKPFTWTAKAKPILASHRRAQKALAIVNAGCK